MNGKDPLKVLIIGILIGLLVGGLAVNVIDKTGGVTKTQTVEDIQDAASEAAKACEKDLPRSKTCKVVITAEVDNGVQ